MDLKEWLKTLSLEEQDSFFRQAARFFTNSELADIINGVRTGRSLYSAHLRAGVLDRYFVDLNNVRKSMQLNN